MEGAQVAGGDIQVAGGDIQVAGGDIQAAGGDIRAAGWGYSPGAGREGMAAAEDRTRRGRERERSTHVGRDMQ